MIVHTLVYSFGDDFGALDQEAFFTEMKEIMMGSRLAQSVDHRIHLPLKADEYAAVFVASAIAWVRCRDVDSLEELSALPALSDFIRRWQAMSPYKVIWANHEELA